VEAALAVDTGVFDAAEPLGKVGTIFECFELRLGIRIVIGDMRSAMGLGDLQIDQQGGHGLAAHAGAAVGVQGERAGTMWCFATGELSPFGGGRHFLVWRRRREGGMRCRHRYVHLRDSHDSHLPFYSNWSEVGVSRHIGTEGTHVPE
jgi:hypothetical protein